MSKAKRKGRFQNFCNLPILVPKECLPLLDELKKKGPPLLRDNNKTKGYIILMALQLMDQHTPYGWGDGPYLGVLPNGPPDQPNNQGPSLRLVPPTTQAITEKGA